MERADFHAKFGYEVFKCIAEYFDFPLWWRCCKNIEMLTALSQTLQTTKCSAAYCLLYPLLIPQF